MERVAAEQAFYVKLGTGGCWAEDAIAQNKFRVGWRWIHLDDMNERRWPAVRRQVKSQLRGKSKGVVTADFNALKRVIESTSDDLWITFHNNSLWWTTLKNGQMRRDTLSTYRLTARSWSNRSITGRELTISNIPGSISQLQGYRATICSVSQLDVLLRTINGDESPAANALREQQRVLVESVGTAHSLLPISAARRPPAVEACFLPCSSCDSLFPSKSPHPLNFLLRFLPRSLLQGGGRRTQCSRDCG